MTLPRWELIVAHWKKVPPLSVSVAALASAFGVGKPAGSGPAGERRGGGAAPQDPQALFDLLGGAGFGTGKPAWLKAAETT